MPAVMSTPGWLRPQRGVLLACLAAAVLLLAAAPAGAFRFRTLGDSVTAGFGYCGTNDGHCGGGQDQLMNPFHLLACASGPLDDRCSSNFGNVGLLGSDVSWAAQFARREGISDVQNIAYQGSTPADWDSGGELHGQLQQLIESRPDLVAMTLGANPVLREFSRGAGLACSLFADEGHLRICVRHFIARIESVKHLVNVYDAILSATNARLFVFSYHNPVPSLAAGVTLRPKVAAILQEINRAVGDAVDQARRKFGGRISLIAPDGSPWGLNHQCTAVQALMGAEWFFSAGHSGMNPWHSSTPWVLDNDACTHPTRAGYTQFTDSLVRAYRSFHGSADLPRPGTAGAKDFRLFDLEYSALQISSGDPRVRITLTEPANLTIRIGADPCLRQLLLHPRCGAQEHVPAQSAARPIMTKEPPGRHELGLRAGDGLYRVTITAKADGGRTTETETIDLVDETRSGLLSIFGHHRPR